VPGPYGTTSVAFRCLDHVGFLHTVLSGLNRTAYALAVYASQGGSSHHHARLASGLAATLSRTGLSTCKVHNEEFPSDCYSVLSSPLPRLRLAQQDLTPKSFTINIALSGQNGK